jgi:hypothetical protein
MLIARIGWVVGFSAFLWFSPALDAFRRKTHLMPRKEPCFLGHLTSGLVVILTEPSGLLPRSNIEVKNVLNYPIRIHAVVIN